MSTFDDPNREAVGLPPIWAEGSPAPAPPAPQAKPAKKSAPEPTPSKDDPAEGD